MDPLTLTTEVDWRFFLLNGLAIYAAYEWGRYRKEKSIHHQMVKLGFAEYYLDHKYRRRWRLSKKET